MSFGLPGDLDWLDTPSCELLRIDLVTLVVVATIGCCLLLQGDFGGTSVLVGGCMRFAGDFGRARGPDVGCLHLAGDFGWVKSLFVGVVCVIVRLAVATFPGPPDFLWMGSKCSLSLRRATVIGGPVAPGTSTLVQGCSFVLKG